jgi:four helix bundle protein
VRDFHKLDVWQKAHDLTVEVYQKTASFPRDEIYGLTNQIRRAAVSIPANISEGCGREGEPELARFLQIAMGSVSELSYELELARDLGYLIPEGYQPLADNLQEIGKMLNVLIQRIRSSINANPPSLAKSVRESH